MTKVKVFLSTDDDDDNNNNNDNNDDADGIADAGAMTIVLRTFVTAN